MPSPKLSAEAKGFGKQNGLHFGKALRFRRQL
jgi:hypothetical protein